MFVSYYYTECYIGLIVAILRGISRQTATIVNPSPSVARKKSPSHTRQKKWDHKCDPNGIYWGRGYLPHTPTDARENFT